LALDVDVEGARETREQCLKLTQADLHFDVEKCDVSHGDTLRTLLRERDLSDPIDLFCSNAGAATGGDCENWTDADWQFSFSLNVMQTAWAAEVLVPSMVSRGGGAFLVTSSAAGLLTQLGAAPYSATKHAAVGLAEWLAITYGDDGLNVCCLCPQGVRTPMVESLIESGPTRALALDGLLDADDVADEALETLAAGRFLCMPGGSASPAKHVERKAADRERWIEGMRRLQFKLTH
jgi:NAD(P)-dependent dehydrogenase (short-subunit alcohol dehydrogenase family)